jgi:protein O-GlcNAc transferase
MPRLIAQAVAHWQQGNRAEAERLCAALLSTSAEQIDARGLLAEIYSAQRDFAGAAEQLRRITALRPKEAAWHRRLGDALFAAGEFAAAADSFRTAIGLEPKHPRAHNNLGRALAGLGEHSAAIDSYRRALALDARYAIAHNNLGIELAEEHRPEEALSAYERAAALNPAFAEAHSNRGNVLLQLARAEEALVCQDRALELEPLNATFHCNRGNTLIKLRRFEEAVASFDRALRLRPEFAEGFNGRGTALRELQQFESAVACFDKAVELKPDFLDPLNNKANVLLSLERFQELLPWCERLLAVKPDFAAALYYRGLGLKSLARDREAIECFAALLHKHPAHPLGAGYLLHSAATICDWSHQKLRLDTLAALPKHELVVSPFVLLAMSGDASLQLDCARSYLAHAYPPAPEPVWRGERWRNDRIRIAYVSADLRDHAVSYLMVGVFEKHDRERFTTIGVSLRPASETFFGRRVVQSFDAWIDVHEASDLKVAQILRDMQVDIAIDLTGFTRGERVNIFAHRCAPLQLSYLGYPATAGTPFHDYILADDFVIPERSRLKYSEQVIYLPDCFQANDDRRALGERKPTRAEAGLPETGIVFCSFNNTHKLSAAQFDVWCRLLTAVPQSVLWIVADQEDARANLIREAGARGITPERLVFAPRMDYQEHLARLSLADLFLDTWPFNAGTTASDALWAGLPVLTLCGEPFAGRMAGSLLRAVGLPELITYSVEQYEARALQLANSPEELGLLRARLAENRLSFPLFHTERFCRHLEAAYVEALSRQQRGESPASFAVAPVAERSGPQNS